MKREILCPVSRFKLARIILISSLGTLLLTDQQSILPKQTMLGGSNFLG